MLKFLAQVTQYYMAARQIQFPSFDETEFDVKFFSQHMLYAIFSLRKKKRKEDSPFLEGMCDMSFFFWFDLYNHQLHQYNIS